jgi:hypothetical protein
MNFYERHPILHKVNPCDADAHPALRPFGRALTTFGSYCPCCSGFRVIAAVSLGAAFPVPTVVATLAALVALTVREAIKGEPAQ